MISNQSTFIFDNPKYLIYFLPKEFVKGSVLSPILQKKKKKNMSKVEVFVPFINMYSSVFEILSSVENRSQLYNRKTKTGNHSFSYCLDEISSEGIKFSQRKKKLKHQLSFFHFFKFREFFLDALDKSCVIKARCLSLQKGGYEMAFYGCQAFYYPNLFLENSINEISTFRGWFSSNIMHYGCLQSFSLLNCELLDCELLDDEPLDGELLDDELLEDEPLDGELSECSFSTYYSSPEELETSILLTKARFRRKKQKEKFL